MRVRKGETNNGTTLSCALHKQPKEKEKKESFWEARHPDVSDPSLTLAISFNLANQVPFIHLSFYINCVS